MRWVMENCVDHSWGFALDKTGSPGRALSQACPDQTHWLYRVFGSAGGGSRGDC